MKFIFIHGYHRKKEGREEEGGQGKGGQKAREKKNKEDHYTCYLEAWVECCSHPEPSMVECILALRQVRFKGTLEPHHIGWVVIGDLHGVGQVAESR